MVLTDELTRTSAVAARAAAREVVNGSKDEGVVPVTLHLEEVSTWQLTGLCISGQHLSQKSLLYTQLTSD